MNNISEIIEITQKDTTFFDKVKPHLDLIFVSVIGIVLLGILIGTIWRASYRFILSFLGNITIIGLVFVVSYFLSKKLFNSNQIKKILRKQTSPESYSMKYYRNLKVRATIINVIGKASIFLIFLGILQLHFLFNLIFIHESSHTLMTILTGNDPQGIYINVEYGGMSFSGTAGSPLERALVVIAGSLGGVTFGSFVICFAIKKRVPFELFFPLLLILGNEILFEIDYWIRGISMKGTDPWVLCHSLEIITPELLRMVTTTSYYIAIALLGVILVYKIIKDIKIYADKTYPDLSPFF
ncbi:MAG: membrane protein of unknown function [Promethearchaeota archaeon]|nr:MAG: membrane protein of unknown function [Candidatus Lokiarchaeota archaeon]